MTTAVRYVGVPDGPTRRIDTFGRDAVTGTDLAALKRAFRSHNHSRLLQVRVDRRGMTYCPQHKALVLSVANDWANGNV